MDQPDDLPEQKALATKYVSFLYLKYFHQTVSQTQIQLIIITHSSKVHLEFCLSNFEILIRFCDLHYRYAR